jgi:hypothetical protein
VSYWYGVSQKMIRKKTAPWQVHIFHIDPDISKPTFAHIRPGAFIKEPVSLPLSLPPHTYVDGSLTTTVGWCPTCLRWVGSPLIQTGEFAGAHECDQCHRPAWRVRIEPRPPNCRQCPYLHKSVTPGSFNWSYCQHPAAVPRMPDRCLGHWSNLPRHPAKVPPWCPIYAVEQLRRGNP